MRLTFTSDLVEEAVLLAARAAAPVAARWFRRERDRVYAIDCADEREATFRALHMRWFARFGLHRVVEETLRERSACLAGVAACRVVRARSRQDEAADLMDEIDPGSLRAGPILVVRLCPATLVDGGGLRPFLHHELTHVADMLDPAFAYERTLPPSESGPSHDAMLRDRYRVVWDTTIDGRLDRAGLADDTARHRRGREFASAFAMLGADCSQAFERWFTEPHPTHAALLAFAAAPGHSAAAGCCPLCRFHVAVLDARAATLPPPVVAAITSRHPGWRAEMGLCARCVDLYEDRYEQQCNSGH